MAFYNLATGFLRFGECQIFKRNVVFSVLSWNPHGESRKGLAKIHKIAYRNELEARPDLVFLQEVPVLEKNAKRYHINLDIYAAKWGCVKPYNIILYKKEKIFCVSFEDVKKQAFTNIASIRRCAGYISMAMEAQKIGESSEKKAVSGKIAAMLKESELEPLADLRIKFEQTWEDDDFKIDQNRIKYLAGCIKGAETNEYDQIKTLLDKHATMALLQVRDSPEEKIQVLAVCYHGPRHSPDNERVLHLLLHLIKQVHKLLGGCPVLLAGDFNIELWEVDRHGRTWLNDYLLASYNPCRAQHRERAKNIDQILLWEDGRRDYTCSLEDVRPKMFQITDGMKEVIEDNANDGDGDGNSDGNDGDDDDSDSDSDNGNGDNDDGGGDGGHDENDDKNDDDCDIDDDGDGNSDNNKHAYIQNDESNDGNGNDYTDDGNGDDSTPIPENIHIKFPVKCTDGTSVWKDIPEEQISVRLARLREDLVEEVKDEKLRREISLHNPLTAVLRVKKKQKKED